MLTPARIGIGRTGHSLPTKELLGFQLAHAKARDAVWQPLDLAVFEPFHPIHLKTQAEDRATYLRRPDLGRRLNPDSKSHLQKEDYQASLILTDGLSAEALHRHAVPFLKALIKNLEGWRLAPITVVEQGRVAIGDEIGERQGAEISVVIIGERPGLSSPDSLGVYLTWSPRTGRTDAERNCVSNIRTEGLLPELAAQRVAWLMNTARQRQLTGVTTQLL